MAVKSLIAKIYHVAMTTAQWSGVAAIPGKGMLLVEFTEDGKANLKVGDGVHPFGSLPYSGGAVDLSDYLTRRQTEDLIDEKIYGIGKPIISKGIKENKSDLPITGNVIGDLWFVQNDTDNSGAGLSQYLWIEIDGVEQWLFLGKGTMDLSNYVTKDDLSGTLEGFVNVGDELTIEVVL